MITDESRNVRNSINSFGTLPTTCSVDGWHFKNCVLTTFFRYISENLKEYINTGEHEAGDETFDYAKLTDEDAEGAKGGLIEGKGNKNAGQYV